jgi:hypothetical protein
MSYILLLVWLRPPKKKPVCSRNGNESFLRVKVGNTVLFRSTNIIGNETTNLYAALVFLGLSSWKCDITTKSQLVAMFCMKQKFESKMKQRFSRERVPEMIIRP